MAPIRLAQLLLDAAKNAPQNGVTYYSPAQEVCDTITYPDLLQAAQDLSRRIVKHLSCSGAPRRRIVLLYSDSQIENLIWFWAVTLAGHIPAFTPPLASNPDYRKHLAHLHSLLDGPLVLTSQRLQHYFEGDTKFVVITSEALRDAEPDLSHSWADSHADDSHGAGAGANNNSTAGDDSKAPARGARAPDDDIAMLMLTSGSTGNSKAVPLRHWRIVASLRGKSRRFGTTRRDVFLNWIGMDHVAAYETLLQAALLGADLVLAEASELVARPRLLLEALGRFRVSVSFSPNFLLAGLLEEEPQEPQEPQEARRAAGASSAGCDLSSLRTIVTGGEACPVGTGARLSRILEGYGAPAQVICPGFGMTETFAGSVYSRAFPAYDLAVKNEYGCLGHPTEAAQMRVRLADGSLAQPGEKGALEMTGPAVFDGYYNNPEATASAFTEDGWFITGDVAYVDDNGNLNLAGRKKDNININGVKFDVERLEAAVEEASLPGVLPAYTVLFSWRPNGSESATESVVVVYVPTFGRDPGDDECRHQTAQGISRVVQAHCGAAPARIIPLPRELLPKSSLGKLSRAKIRQAFEAGGYSEHERTDRAALARHGEATFRAPSTRYEEAVRDAVAGVAGTEPGRLSVTSGMLEAGLTSMDLLKTKASIEERLGTGALPLSAMAGGSIEAVARAIAELSLGPAPAEYDPVVVLNEPGGTAAAAAARGGRAPLWLVHPGAGEVLIYLKLANYFLDRPVYALRARGFDAGQAFWGSYDEAVASYADHVQRRQPGGPVAILGYSLGSAFAFGTARRLQDAGREVRFLGLMNMPPDWAPMLRRFSAPTSQVSLAVFLGLLREERAEAVLPGRGEEALARMGGAETLDALEPLFERPLREVGLGRAQFLRWAALALRLHRTVEEVRPSGAVPSIDVFSAFPLAVSGCASVEEYTRRHLVLWDRHSAQPLRVHACEGKHFTMISEDNVASFQKTLKAAMRARGVL